MREQSSAFKCAFSLALEYRKCARSRKYAYVWYSSLVSHCVTLQRDMAERGHSLDSIKKSIEARKPDFNAYVDPQKKDADVIIQVLPTQLVPDTEGKYLRVRLIQKEGKKLFDPAYLFDEGSTISWIPCGRKLTCSFPGESRPGRGLMVPLGVGGANIAPGKWLPTW